VIETSDTHRWPCAQCGSDLRFAPNKGALECTHCGHVQPMKDDSALRAATALRELSLDQGLRDELPSTAQEETRATSCPSCGAVVEFSGAHHAANCPYCATPVVVDTGARRHIKPQALVPFALTETQARTALGKWLGSLWFAPNGLLEYTRKGRAMAGIYAPFWTFDAATTSRYTGARGEHYYETRNVTMTVNGKSEQRTEQVQRTRWYPASGTVSRDFDDVITLASKSLPKRLGNELTPWDISAAQPYTPDYLAGFQAEGYTIALSDGWEDAKTIMNSVINGDIRADIGGDTQRIDSVQTRYSNETFKHLLMPIWTAAYKYRGRSFHFLVNGQTGEVQGERPYSAWKIGFAIAFVAAVVFGVLYLNDPESLGLPRPEWMDNFGQSTP
jgi:DNA-directed RNA polymerase subunit RPC12/RpoP